MSKSHTHAILKDADIPRIIRKESPVQDSEHPVWNDDSGLFQESDAQFKKRILARYQKDPLSPLDFCSLVP